MIRTLQMWLGPLIAVLLTVWAAVLALAAEAWAPLPRMLARGRREESGLPSRPRRLYLVRLTLLLGAAAAAGTGVGWWQHPAAAAAPRLALTVVLVWLVGDLLPRVLAAVAPDLVAMVQGIARASVRLFAPLLRTLAWAGRRRRHPERRLPTDQGRDMLHGVFALREMAVSEVMTPRIDVASVDLESGFPEVIQALRGSGHSRLLVTEGHPDAVAGVLYAKDLIPGLTAPDELDWRSRVRPAQFVPEAKTLADQLRDFQRGPSHLAVVVDEFGGTAGLVTLEDVLEQVVGEIQDEYDAEDAPVVPVADGRWLVQGGLSVAELEALLDHQFDREDVDTVGGLVLAALGHVPRVGETAELGPWRLIVDQVVRRRVGRVLVERTGPAEDEGEVD